MTGMAYKIVLRLLAPLHIGAGASGNVQRTRPYVHGKVLWGALTARMTRDNPDLNGDYAGVGNRLHEELTFGYLYPAIGQQIDLWPWQDPDAFSWRYLDTYASTALDYSGNTAKEGSLHETEFIAPTTREDREGREGRPVYLIGYLCARNGSSLPWQQALPRLQLGGERGYGWGQVQVENVQKWDPAQPLFDCYNLQLDTWPPVLQAAKGTRLLAHALAADFNGKKAVQGAKGPIEPLVGRETRSGGRFGMQVSQARICYTPGSLVTAPDFACRIGRFGVWEAVQ